jgi:hypothetical protein
MNISMRSAIAVAAVACSAVLVASTARAQNGGKEHFTAFAVDTSNTAPRGAATTTVDIVINRYSSDADRDRLLEALDQGQDALLKALQKLPVVGYLTTPGSLRYDIHFAWQRPAPDGGRNIVVVTDRYISMWEATNRPRTIDYPFTLIQLQLNKNDEGVGKASIATKITKTDNYIELENFSSEPVRLNNVHKVKD